MALNAMGFDDWLDVVGEIRLCFGLVGIGKESDRQETY